MFLALAEIVAGELWREVPWETCMGRPMAPAALESWSRLRCWIVSWSNPGLWSASPWRAPRGPSQPGVILEVRDLSVAYGTKTAVDGVSLQMTRGEIFGLLGPNGAGKTSTLSAVEGLIKPQSGAVFLDGIDVRRHPSRRRPSSGCSCRRPASSRS